MNRTGLSPDEILDMIDKSNFSSAREKIEAKIKLLNKYISWTEDDYREYKELLDTLRKVRKNMNRKTKRDKQNSSKLGLGKSLENIVNFIFEKSYFYKVYPNKRTATNEIDQFIVISDRGKQAIEEYKFSKDLLGINDGYLLCECKNHKGTVGSTWVGKFYTLMNVSGNCSLGIIFSYDGLTGEEDKWYDAHGLTKIIYRMSPEKRRNFILDFNINDFELLKSKDNTIFSIINSKKQAIVSNINSEKLLDDNCEGKEEIREIYNEIKTINKCIS